MDSKRKACLCVYGRHDSQQAAARPCNFMSEKVKVGLSFLWKTSTHEYFTHVTNFLQATKVNYPNILLIRKYNYGNLVMKGQH